MVTLVDVHKAKYRLNDHLEILAGYITAKKEMGFYNEIPGILREYADMIERDINMCKTINEKYREDTRCGKNV